MTAIWTGLMAGFAPAPTDRTTTNTGDIGGPTGLDDGPRCPYCGETVLVEFDPVSRHYVCLVCARTWAPKA